MALDFSPAHHKFIKKKNHLSYSIVCCITPAPADSLQILLQSVCHSQCASPWQTVWWQSHNLCTTLGPEQIVLTGQEHTPHTGRRAPSPPPGNSWLAAISAFFGQVGEPLLYIHKCRHTLSWSGISQARQKRKEQRSSARSHGWAWLQSAFLQVASAPRGTYSAVSSAPAAPEQISNSLACVWHSSFWHPKFRKHCTFHCPPNTGEQSPINVFLHMARKDNWYVPWNYHTRHRFYKFW